MPTVKFVAIKTLASSVTKTISFEIYYFQVNVLILNKPRSNLYKPDFYFLFLQHFKVSCVTD